MAKKKSSKNAIILAMFGTSVEDGLVGLLHIKERVSLKFPNTPVRMVFTSKVLRQIWKERDSHPEYSSIHPEVPIEILKIQSPEAVIHQFQKEGIDSLVIQPIQIAPETDDTFHGDCWKGIEEANRKDATLSFTRIAIGKPILGALGKTSLYREDIVKAARSIAEDAAMARQEKAALFYMGHGNKNPETNRVYDELVTEIRRLYPDIVTVMSMIEGSCSSKDILCELREHEVDKVILKAFMVVAGNHVRKDMLGKGSGSLHTLLVKEGIEVLPVMKGLGENTVFADIFVEHVVDAARVTGIKLR